jgi:hypothetical protein
MEKAGYTRLAATLALTNLRKNGLIGSDTDSDHNGNSYVVYFLMEAGVDWLIANEASLALHYSPMPPEESPF